MRGCSGGWLHGDGMSDIEAASIEGQEDAWTLDNLCTAPPMKRGPPIGSHEPHQRGFSDMRGHVGEALVELFNEKEMKDRQQEYNSINDIVQGFGRNVSSISNLFCSV